MRFWLGLLTTLVVALSARAAPPLEAYGRPPAIEDVAISPSGDRFALVGRDRANRSLYVRRKDGLPELIASLGSTRVRGLQWAGEDRLVVFTNLVTSKFSDLGGQSVMVATVLDLKSKKSYFVFDGSNSLIGTVAGWFGTREIDGRWYGYAGGVPFTKYRDQHETHIAIYPDLYRIDLATGAYEPIALAGAGRTLWVISKDGTIAGHSRYDAKGRKQTIYLGADDTRPLLSKPIEAGRLVLDGLGRFPDSLLIRDATSGEELAREFRPENLPIGETLYSGVEGSTFVRSPASGLLMGVSHQDYSAPQFLDPNFEKIYRATSKAFPDVMTSLVSQTEGMTTVVVRTDGAGDPGTFWYVDVAKKSARPIGQIRPEIKPDDMATVSLFSYTASDQTPLEGVLTTPQNPAKTPLPLVIFPRDAVDSLRTGVRFDPWAQAFASRGYAVLQPSTRGARGYGEAFRKLGDGQVGLKLQSDLSDGVAALAARGLIDPKRVCIVGKEYGGYAALAGVTLQQGIYRCAVSIAGVSDVRRMVSQINAIGDHDRRQTKTYLDFMGNLDGEDLLAISPLRSAKRVESPILMIHGKDDLRVPVEQSELMASALRSAGKSVELLTLAGEDHYLTKEGTPEKVLATAVAFVEKNNPPN